MTYEIMPALLELLRKEGALRQNYRGELIPVGAGFLVIWAGCVTSPLLLSPLFYPNEGLGVSLAALYITTVLGYGLLGLFDDLVGSRRETGLKGHGIALIQGHLTSGAIKALQGVAFGLVLAALRLGAIDPLSRQWLFAFLVDGLIMPIAANTLNLLDLRPGRAGKVFLVSSLLLMLTGNPISLALLPWIGGLLGYLPFDLKGEAMMGDVGANALGALLGLTSCCVLSLTVRFLLLISLIILHLLAERISLSQVIENHSLLEALDRWGRKGP